MDKGLFEKIFSISMEYPIVGKLTGWLASATAKLYFLVYAGIGVYLVYMGDDKLLIYILFPVLAIMTSYTFRQTIKRGRPFEEFPIKPYVEVKKKSYGMPSNHAAAAMVISMACMYFNMPLGIVMVILTVLLGVCRVFAGIHYPFDILTGWIISLIYGSLMLYILL